MTIDVATLTFEFRSDSALVAEERMNKLIATGDKLEGAERRRRTATDRIADSQRGAAGAAERTAQANIILANSEGAVERATRGAGRVSAEVRAQRQLEARAMAELVQATKAYERDQAQAAKTASAAQGAADREAERSAAQVLAFRQRMARQRAAEEAAAANQAVAAQDAADREAERSAQQVTAFRMRMARQRAAEEAAAAKAAAQAQIAADRELDAQIASAVRGQNALNGAWVGGTRSAKGLQLAALDLSRQFADVGVTAAMGMNPFMILIQQGPQIADRLAVMKAEGVGFGAAMKSIAVSMGLLTVSTPPAVAQAAELAVAEQAAAAAALDVAVANRAAAASAVTAARAQQAQAVTAAEATAAEAALATATAAQVAAFEAATVAAAGLAAANEAVAVTATAAAAAEATALAPVAAAIAGVVGVVAAFTVGWALMARELNKGFPKDVTDGLKLTEDQLDRVKHKSVTMGDVFLSTLDVMGKYLMQGPVGEGIRRLDRLWNAFLDGAAKLAFETMATITGVIVGTYRTVVHNWRNFPAVMKDIFVGALNAAIDEMQRMVNGAIESVNQLKRAAALFMPALNLLPDIPEADLSRWKGQMSGAAEFVGTAFRENVGGAIEEARAGLRQLGKEIGAGALKRAQDRARKEAGDAPDGRKGAVRDMSDERLAQIEAMLAQAMQEELQARRAITREATDRAEIERQIVQAALVEKQARIDQQVAAINDKNNKSLDAAQKAELTARLRGVKIVNEITASLQTRAIDEGLQADLAKQALDTQRATLQNQMDLLDAQAGLTQSAYARSFIEADILKLKQQEERATLEAVTIANGYNAAAVQDAQQRLAYLAKIHPLQLREIERQQRLVNAIAEASDAARGFRDAFRRHDWAGIFDNLVRTIETIRASFAANGMGGGLMTAGSAVASLIGGRTGRIAGNALGIAGLGMGFGAYMGSSAGLAMAGGLGGAIGGAAGAGVANGLVALGSVAGPIAIAAAALYAAAKIFHLGGKPSNHGAGFDLRTGQLSGDKRNQETENAARSAGAAIIGIQDALKAAGIGIKDAVTGLVIGTRDASQIYLQSGKTLTSAVGDSAAAVDTAMRALLEGATYVSDAQKKLVDSALAAGKGFDAIAEILAAYEAAQNISGSLADEILKLTDPQAFDRQAVTRAIEAQRDAYKKLTDEGYLTADQLAAINAQLATLQGLRLDEVAKRYGGAGAANDNTLQSATEAAKDALLNAYSAFAEAKNAEISALRQAAEGLRNFRRELDFGAIAGRDPVSQYAATKREFERLSALSASDPERRANLQGVAQAFVEASRAASPTQLAFERDLNAVRRATDLTADAADSQANIAQAQLDAATAQLVQLGLLNGATNDMATALKNYLAAVENERAGTGAVNDNLDVAKYLARNPDLAANWNAGGIMRTWGATLEEATRYHYQQLGKAEIAAGKRFRGYAAGGDHPGGWRLVGEEGPEIEATGPARYFSARETERLLSGGGEELADEVRALRETVTAQADLLRRIAVATDQTQSEMKDMKGAGLFVRGRDPEDPVQTEAA